MFLAEHFAEYLRFAEILSIATAVQTFIFVYYIYKRKKENSFYLVIFSLAILSLIISIITSNFYHLQSIKFMKYVSFFFLLLFNFLMLIFCYRLKSISKTGLILLSLSIPLLTISLFLELKIITISINAILTVVWLILGFKAAKIVLKNQSIKSHPYLLIQCAIFMSLSTVSLILFRVLNNALIFNTLSFLFMTFFSINFTGFLTIDETLFHPKFRNRTLFDLFVIVLFIPVILLIYYIQHFGLFVYLQTNINTADFAIVSQRIEIIITNATILSELLLITLYIIRSYILITGRIREKQFIEMSFIRERLFDLSNNPMFILKGSMIVNINRSAQELFGRLPDEILNRPVDDFLQNKYDGQPISVLMQTRQSPKLESNLVKQDGSFLNCQLDITTLSESNDQYRLCEIRDFNYFEKEVRSARIIQSLYSILVSGEYWHNKVRDMAEMIRSAYRCSMIYIYLQGYEGFYNYGSVDEDLSGMMKKFYFDPDLEILTEYSGDVCAILLKIKTESKQYGTLCIKINRTDMDDTTIDTLMNICRVIAQFVESTILIGELRSSETTYRALSESSFVGIAILQDMTIQYVNPRYTEISGYQPSDVIGMNHPGPFFPPDMKEKIIGSLKKEFDTSDRMSLQNIRGIRKNGQSCFVSLYYNKIEYRRKPAALLQISDVTAEVEAEKQKERITQLLIKDQKMKTLKNLVSGLSHEFNNVFAIIKGYVELLSFDSEVSPKIEDDLKVIHEATQRGIDITNRMHVFIRHDQLKQNDINLKIFFEVSRPLLLNLVHKKNPRIDFIIDLEPDALSIVADEFGLEEIFYNLIMNSLDAIDKKGEIKILSRRINDNYCSIEFSDNGKGIPEDAIDSIFDPFFTTKGPDEGTGLGLYIVYELVKSMNGDIAVDSEPGKGTTFKIMFPTSKS